MYVSKGYDCFHQTVKIVTLNTNICSKATAPTQTSCIHLEEPSISRPVFKML
jgi:hypothetical protein